MLKVLLSPNPVKDPNFSVTHGLLSYLDESGFTVLADVNLAPSIGDKWNITFLQWSQALQECDFILVIGGDGSILSVAADAANSGKPILGLNSGTIGFMTEIEPSELHLIDAVKADSFTLDLRSMLDVLVYNSQNEIVFSSLVLNEAAVTKGVQSKTIRLTINVEGEETITFNGDGIIVATPTGSTAYSMAAGGPIIKPSSPCVAVTPLCPVTLGVRPFVVDIDDEIVLSPHYGRGKFFLSPDGFESYSMQEGDRVYIKKSEKTTSLIRLKGTGFYERIRTKLIK